MPKKLLLLLIILLIAFGLRTYGLTEFPPGLTHDEANHGREAIDILDGVLLFFFPLNYGSEPLYSYTVAGTMGLLGKHLFSLRLVNVIFGLAAMTVAYRWTKRAFDRRTALLAMALTAVSFWPLASSREALRAGMLPFFMGTAVWFFWQSISIGDNGRPLAVAPTKKPVIGFALSVAATLHIYLAARVAWLLFPAFACYLALWHRDAFRSSWKRTVAGLLLAALLIIPMFAYLNAHPEVMTRLDMLDKPLEQLRQGNISPLLANAGEAFLAFIWPGSGDEFLAYNIPGRPVLDALTAIFFVTGIVVSLWRWKRPAYAFILIWFAAGIAPSLITGATANTTRNLAALSVVHLLPAVGFIAIVDIIAKRAPRANRSMLAGLAGIWILAAGWITLQDYFVVWNQSAAVRGAYQHTLVESLDYLDQSSSTAPVVLSTVYPGPAHDPSIGQVMLARPDFETRWVDARYAFIFPIGENARAIIPASTPLHPAFGGLITAVDTIAVRTDDLDPEFTLYELNDYSQLLSSSGEPVNFGDAITLLSARWLRASVSPGDTNELLTIWRVEDPDRVGPRVLPLYTTDVVLFTHVLDKDGSILAQRDALDAPSWDWQAGDLVAQIHAISVPLETSPGEYQTAVGIYDRHSLERLPLISESGAAAGDHTFVLPLQVASP